MRTNLEQAIFFSLIIPVRGNQWLMEEAPKYYLNWYNGWEVVKKNISGQQDGLITMITVWNEQAHYKYYLLTGVMKTNKIF